MKKIRTRKKKRKKRRNFFLSLLKEQERQSASRNKFCRKSCGRKVTRIPAFLIAKSDLHIKLDSRRRGANQLSNYLLYFTYTNLLAVAICIPAAGNGLGFENFRPNSCWPRLDLAQPSILRRTGAEEVSARNRYAGNCFTAIPGALK